MEHDVESSSRHLEESRALWHQTCAFDGTVVCTGKHDAVIHRHRHAPQCYFSLRDLKPGIVDNM